MSQSTPKVFKSDLGKGEYDVDQVNDTLLLGGNIHYDIGPVQVNGDVNTTTWEASVTFYFLGIKIGELSGNLKDGIQANVNTFAFKGYIRLYLEGDKLLLTWKVKSKLPGGGTWEDSIEITIG